MTLDVRGIRAEVSAVTADDVEKFYQGGAIPAAALDITATPLGETSSKSADDFRALILAQRMKLSEDPVRECLASLRKELRNFVSSNQREAGEVGFRAQGGDPLDCSGIIEKVRSTIVRLETLGERIVPQTPLSAGQSRAIPQLTAVMDEFLLDLASMTRQGEVSSSGVVPVLKACVQLARVVGECAQALAALK